MAKQSLLVADADPRSLRILEVALRKAGFAVSTASDGAEVLRKLQRTQLDAVLCELSLPGEDGLAVCRSVRADARLGALPILLMNADGTNLRVLADGPGALSAPRFSPDGDRIYYAREFEGDVKAFSVIAK